MSTLPWPHRVTFLAPILWLPRGEEDNYAVAGTLLATILHEHYMRHPIVAVTDFEDVVLTDESDRLIDVRHPRAGDVVHSEMWANRRDEVLWFELALYPPMRAILTSLRRDGTREQWQSTEDSTVSGLLETCLDQWLAARWLPKTPLRLEPMLLHDFLHTVHQAARALKVVQTNPPEAQQIVQTQSALRVPFLRMVDAASGFALDEQILRREADNPKALFHLWNARAEKGLKPPIAELRKILSLAPHWGKPYLAMIGHEVPAEESLEAHAIATRLMPRSASALDAYAMALRMAGRFEDAYRAARRSTRMVPTFLAGHLHVLYALQGCHRHGEAFLQSQARLRVLREAWQATRAPMDRPRRDFLITVAHMMYDVGRVQDAIRQYQEAIEGLGPTELVAHRNILRKWESGPGVRALAFARDAHYRGDPGGVIYGTARAHLEEGADAARATRALIDLGASKPAAVAAGLLEGMRLGDAPPARLAAARALILNGELSRAYDRIQHVQLRWPQYRWESEINRLLRLAATRPHIEWEAVLRDRYGWGGVRLARLAARDAADFVPGIERSAVYRAIAPELRHLPYDRAWLEPLKQALGHNVLVEIDLFFHRYSDPSPATADRLVNDWPALVAARKASDPTADAQTLFVLAESLCRYLALTTQPPTPLAGAYRQVATDAMLSASRAGVEWMTQSIRPFMYALEQVAEHVDPWLFDTWLLRVERALDLDFARDATVRELSAGTRRVSEVLRGDERVAFELQLARDLVPLSESNAQAREHLERCVRATGAVEVAAHWSETAKALDKKDAIDVHFIATALVEGQHLGPILELATELIAAGRGEAAVDVMARAAWAMPAKAAAAFVGRARAVWLTSGSELPHDPIKALAWGEGQLRAGKNELAVRALRWAAATSQDPKAMRAYATACARAERWFETAIACGAMERIEKGERATLVGAVQTAQRILFDANQADAAAAAARLEGMLAGRFGHDSSDPAIRCWAALYGGDLAGARNLAAAGQSWPLTRAALTAAAVRTDQDSMFPVAAGVRGQLDGILSATAGQLDEDAALTRINALRLREDAMFAVDPPPPLAAMQPRSVLG